MDRAAQPFDVVQRPAHYNKHPSGVECIEIAEYMGFNLGNAFKYLWRGGLKDGDATQDYEKALWYLRRFDEQMQPAPHTAPAVFREIMATRRKVFNRPSPWCESIRFALAAMCDLCCNPEVAESERLTGRAIRCVETALADERCLGRGIEP
jgi:hypothetical protein